MTDTKRIKECRRKIVAAINEAKIPFAVSELVLESVLAIVRENMAAEEASDEAAAQGNEQQKAATQRNLL